ncbi:MAG: EamA family transporter [Microbacteriaceae bacterium]
MSRGSNTTIGYIASTVGALLFGLNGVVIKILMDGTGLTGFQVTQFRVAGAALLMGATMFVINKSALRLRRRQVIPIVLMGVAVASLQATYAIAVHILPVGIALLLEYTAVLAVALIAFFVFKEKVKARIWVAIGLVLAGLVVVAEIWNTTLDPIGVLWALIASASLTAYFILGERQTDAMPPMAVGFWTMTVATVFWSFLSGWWTIDPTIFLDNIPLTADPSGILWPAWLLMVINIVVGTFFSFTLSLFAISRLKATRAGIVATSEILFAFLFAFVLLGETLNFGQIVGATVVLVGIVVAQTAREGRAVEADLALIVEETT